MRFCLPVLDLCNPKPECRLILCTGSTLSLLRIIPTPFTISRPAYHCLLPTGSLVSPALPHKSPSLHLLGGLSSLKFRPSSCSNKAAKLLSAFFFIFSAAAAVAASFLCSATFTSSFFSGECSCCFADWNLVVGPLATTPPPPFYYSAGHDEFMEMNAPTNFSKSTIPTNHIPPCRFLSHLSNLVGLKRALVFPIFPL